MRRSDWFKWVLALGAVASVSGGCSAIVDPNTRRLFDEDAFGPGTDTGIRADTGTPIDTGTLTPPDAGTDAPGCPADCSDGIACTDDACDGVRCTHTANDTLCPGERCNAGTGCVPVQCVTAADCDDDNACNGAETCVPGSSPTGCQPGPALSCEDAFPCTVDGCDPASGCTHTGNDAACDDMIPCTRNVCEVGAGCRVAEMDNAVCNTGCTTGAMCTPIGCRGGSMSCDDMSPCTADSCAMMMCVHDPVDADRDGVPASSVRVSGTTVSCTGTDCNDGDPMVNPRATELCNGRDDNCNGTTDEGCMAATGETCAAAIPLTLSGSGTATVTGMLDATRVDDYVTSCGRAGGRDLVYALTLTQTADVRIETTGGVDTVLGVGLTCDVANFTRQCNDDQNPGVSASSRIWLRRVTVAPGSTQRLFILVDGFDGAAASTGAFTLNVATTAPPLGDLCAATTLNVTGGGSVYGNIGVGVGTQAGSCQPGISITPEAIFRFEGARIEQLTATSSDFVPALHVRTSCFRGDTQVACVNGAASMPSGGSATLMNVSTGGSGGGPLSIFVDNGTSGGAYRLDVNP
jgi:hypothetical protein